MQQNKEFKRFDINRRNLLESCSIKEVFLSNDRAEFKLLFDAENNQSISQNSGKCSQIRGNVKFIHFWLKLSAILVRQ